jgi:anhydro-N-acetylmuramic acid kinase
VAEELYVGLMSGTSLDGIDAVLAGFDSGRPVCHATHFAPFDQELRDEALALHFSGADELHRAAHLANRLARAYAQATADLLAAAAAQPASVRAVGCHGQTVRHAPENGYSAQINNPALLAELSGIAVVADFRSRDIAAGGQGAPLVPAFHDQVFRDDRAHRVILNIGGIANLTDLAPGKPTRGFDCGPGNMLIDAWAQSHLGRPYDADGAWARCGQTLPDLLARLSAHKFLKLPPPKSCGREQFNTGWLDSLLTGGERPEDVQATLTAFTAGTAAEAIDAHCAGAQEVFVCGGGAHNGTLMSALDQRLPSCRVDTTAVLGLPPDWVEAMAFAWLAMRCVHDQPGSLAEVTGAHGARILGAIYPA